MKSDSIYIIAEAGVNHNGCADMARQMIDVAVNAGADAVKFQTFDAHKLVVANAEKADYQKRSTDNNESQLSMLQRLQLSHQTHHQLQQYCSRKGVDFLSTAFDLDSLEFLVAELELDTLKIPSGEITNAPLLLAYARSGCQLIVSTGMCSLQEVEKALGVLAFGMTASPRQPPCEENFASAFASEEGQQLLKDRVTLLHCTTEYPAPLDDINLKAMDTLAEQFGLPVGYSDHSEGIIVSVAAAARGARVIEKHFTLDRSLPGPDHKASLEPDQLTQMISDIRTVSRALGESVKQPQPSELANLKVARKSLVALQDIAAGTVFDARNLGVMRPGGGVSPYRYWSCLGKPASRDYVAGALIDE